MPPVRDYAPLLDRLFRRSPVALLGQLCRALDTDSRTTVFRALTAVGYLTSYSHAGRYYTLSRIPTFDARGLWAVRDVRFSKHGTLRATVELMVKESPAGQTHEELQAILGLRVHDPLRGLVEAGCLARERLDALYVYVDAEAGHGAKQLERRRTATRAPATAAQAPLALARVIDVLLAVIHAPRANALQIAAQLQVRGLAVTETQAVFDQYELGKKTARSRSPRSPR